MKKITTAEVIGIVAIAIALFCIGAFGYWKSIQSAIKDLI